MTTQDHFILAMLHSMTVALMKKYTMEIETAYHNGAWNFNIAYSGFGEGLRLAAAMIPDEKQVYAEIICSFIKFKYGQSHNTDQLPADFTDHDTLLAVLASDAEVLTDRYWQFDCQWLTDHFTYTISQRATRLFADTVKFKSQTDNFALGWQQAHQFLTDSYRPVKKRRGAQN